MRRHLPLIGALLLAALSHISPASAGAEPHSKNNNNNNDRAQLADEELFRMSDLDWESNADLAAADEPGMAAAAAACESACKVNSEQADEQDEGVQREQEKARSETGSGAESVASNEPAPASAEDQADKHNKAAFAATAAAAEPWAEPRNRLGFLSLLASGFKSHYENQYDKINEYLVKEVNRHAGAAENLAKARELLQHEQQRGVSIFKNRVTVEALEQFVKLTTVMEDGVRCSPEAYAILWKNNQATRGRAHKPPSQLGVPRRIERVVNSVATQHSISCFHVYPRRLHELRAKMDAQSVKLVETFLNNYMKSCDCSRTNLRQVRGRRAAETAYNLIGQHALRDPNLKYLGLVPDEVQGALVVEVSGVTALLEQYVVEPCRQFVYQLGPEVFIPARFGSLVLEKDDRYDESLHEFLHSWLQYRLCESLVRHDKGQLANDLVRYIKQVTK